MYNIFYIQLCHMMYDVLLLYVTVKLIVHVLNCLGGTLAWWLVLPAAKQGRLIFDSGPWTFLCPLCIISSCLCRFSTGSTASYHNPAEN